MRIQKNFESNNCYDADELHSFTKYGVYLAKYSKDLFIIDRDSQAAMHRYFSVFDIFGANLLTLKGEEFCRALSFALSTRPVLYMNSSNLNCAILQTCGMNVIGDMTISNIVWLNHPNSDCIAQFEQEINNIFIVIVICNIENVNPELLQIINKNRWEMADVADCICDWYHAGSLDRFYIFHKPGVLPDDFFGEYNSHRVFSQR